MSDFRWLMMAVAGLGMSWSIHSAAAPGKDKEADVILPAGDIQWQPGPTEGTHLANLWGDWRKNAPFGTLVRFDAGVMHPLHRHTRTLRIVVLSGTFVHQPEGGTETRLGPGSYVLQRGGLNHVSGCAPETECEFFMSSNGKFDFIPVEEPAAGKKK
ncbi:MAG TPA: DUF4437 domain-containing protein [Candidatus Binatia bacterium]|nr:DUF4437 domain-containing protein [Candidatus Binatia bacterium]